MADPGLYSKFVEIQQEDAFAPRSEYVPPDARLESLRLDRARILEQLKRATHVRHIALLHKSLCVLENDLNEN